MCHFWISINSFLFTQVYCSQLDLFFEVKVVKQATSCVVIFLACDKFFSLAICSHVIFHSLMKKVASFDHDILVFLTFESIRLHICITTSGSFEISTWVLFIFLMQSVNGEEFWMLLHSPQSSFLCWIHTANYSCFLANVF